MVKTLFVILNNMLTIVNLNPTKMILNICFFFKYSMRSWSDVVLDMIIIL